MSVFQGWPSLCRQGTLTEDDWATASKQFSQSMLDWSSTTPTSLKNEKFQEDEHLSASAFFGGKVDKAIESGQVDKASKQKKRKLPALQDGEVDEKAAKKINPNGKDVVASMINLVNKGLKKAALTTGETAKSKLSKAALEQVKKHVQSGEDLRKELTVLATKKESNMEKKQIRTLAEKTTRFHEKMTKFIQDLKPYVNKGGEKKK